MNRLDVLFVIPTNVLDFVRGRVRDAIEPPAKARFIAAYLMRRNCSVALIDSNITDQLPEQLAKEVAAANPYLVVIPVYGYNPSASTQTMPSARLFAQAIKNLTPEIPIMFSGTHPAAIPEKTLRDEPIDFVCGGEGPITVHELLQAIKAGGAGIERVRSLWRWQDGAVVANAPAPLIDLNEEPVSLEAWRLMDPRKYSAHHWQTFYHGLDNRGPYANPYSVEGCPFHCGFCNIQATYREGEQYDRDLGLLKPGVNSYRFLKPELFVAELTYLVEEFGVRFIKIPDEMFGLNTAHVMTIARLVQERFGDSLNFWCYFRVDTCKPKFLDPLRAAGFHWLAIGIEAANSKVRSGQDKRFGEETIHEVVGKIHVAGIQGALNYIFGLSEFEEGGFELGSFDTLETMEATYQLACELNGTYGNFYCAQALPGSKLYLDAKVSGYPLPERRGGPGWIGHAQYSYESEPCYLGNALTPAQILAFRDEKHIAYYRRPEYRRRLLTDPKFGQVALDSIDEWIAGLEPDKLKRKIIEEEACSESLAVTAG